MNLIKTIFTNPLTLWCYWIILKYVNEYKYAEKKLSIKYLARFNNCKFGMYNTLYPESHMSNVTLGDYSYVGAASKLSYATIGKFTCVGPNVRVGLGKHPSHDFVSIHPAFYSTLCQAQFTFSSMTTFDEFEQIQIGNDVWIGAHAIILDGVSIGDGCIVGAGAVVTKNIPAYAVVGGVPAKILRYRFDSSEIDYLMKFKWWDRNYEWLKNNVLIFNDIKKFIKHENI